MDASSGRDDEGRRLVVISKTVGIRAHGLGCFGVVVGTAFVRSVVFAQATILVRVVFGTSREARVECRSLDVAVGIRIHVVSRSRWGIDLEIPRTPLVSITCGDLCFKRQGI